MSELFDKEVDAQKESLKKLLGSHKLLQAHEKRCAMKMKETKKNDAHVKMFNGRRAFIERACSKVV